MHPVVMLDGVPGGGGAKKHFSPVRFFLLSLFLFRINKMLHKTTCHISKKTNVEATMDHGRRADTSFIRLLRVF